MFITFTVFILFSVFEASKSESPILIDLIHQFIPVAIHIHFAEELHQNGNDLLISADLNNKIQNHLKSMLSQLPNSEAINNFLDQFPLDKQVDVQKSLKEALAIGLSERMIEKPAVTKPLHPTLISPKRLQQILPDKLLREILEELFLRGGLEHLSPKLRQKVHEQMEQLRNAYVLPSDAMIEEFIQHFPLEIRQDLKDIADKTKATGHLPRANDSLRSEIQTSFKANDRL
ncbi:uncharacterized protein LOC135699504 [Ochlerotatus camptorhynchus]|uniref:uncharacterized protein LOC135699504 n=1 Tax=Ochlerotatus camptorhynchus TaxID=644619 RepID=UPI0031D9DED7